MSDDVVAPILDMADPDNFQNGHPHDIYDRLRTESPVHYQPSIEGRPAHWILTRYNDIQTVSRNNKVYSSASGQRLFEKGGMASLSDEVRTAVTSSLISRDPPSHTELRKPLAPHFLPSAMRRIEAEVEQFVDELIAEMRGREEIEFVEEFAARVPIRTLCSLLGVPKEDEDKVFDWTNRLVGTSDPEYGGSPEESTKLFEDIFDYGKYLLEKRRSAPSDDILTVVANMTVAGTPLDRPTRDGTFVILLAADNETTRNSLTGGMMALSSNPSQKRLLIEDPTLINNGIEEILRYVTPVIQMMRTATDDTKIGGKKISAGDRVVMLYGAANRDPQIFDNPHQFDIRRENANRHLAFGIGIHHCLGAPLARLQLRILIQKLLQHFPDIRAISEPEYLRSNFVLGVKRIKFRIDTVEV